MICEGQYKSLLEISTATTPHSWLEPVDDNLPSRRTILFARGKAKAFQILDGHRIPHEES
jgi:hypothetical protein